MIPTLVGAGCFVDSADAGRHAPHRARCASSAVPPGARVLAVVPDRTRDDNTDVLFPMISQELAAIGASRFDALVAQGTHPPMTDADKRAKIGAGRSADCRCSASSSIITGIVNRS